MTKVFLLSNNTNKLQVSTTVLKWYHRIAGILSLLLLIVMLTDPSFSRLIICLLLFSAITSIFYGFFVLNERSSIAPKIRMSPERLEIKNRIFSKAHIFKWKDIDYLQFSPSEITINTATKSTRFFFYTQRNSVQKILEDLQAKSKEHNFAILGA